MCSTLLLRSTFLSPWYTSWSFGVALVKWNEMVARFPLRFIPGRIITIMKTCSPSEESVLTPSPRPYWYTYYTFVAFLFMQISYRPLRWNLEGMAGGLEVPILDALWVGLLGLEAVMIIYVLLLRISGAIRKEGKIKEL